MHLLDSVVLSETHAALVGDVVDAALGLRVLAARAAHLQVVLGGNLLQLGLVGRQLRQLDMHGGTHGCAQVGWAESKEPETVVVRERDALLDIIDSIHQPLVHLLQVTAHLHGDEAEVVLLVAPHQERLVLVVVDAAAGRPEAAGVGGLQEAVTLFEQEVIVDQLLLGLLGHAGQGVEGTLELSFKSGESAGHFLFHLLVLGLGQARVEGVSLHGAATAHTGGDHELAGGVQVSKSLDISPVLGGVSVSFLETGVVVLDDGIEELSEHGVSFRVGRVDSDTRVQVLDAWKPLCNVSLT